MMKGWLSWSPESNWGFYLTKVAFYRLYYSSLFNLLGILILEQNMRIELTSQPWQGHIIPLYEFCITTQLRYLSIRGFTVYTWSRWRDSNPRLNLAEPDYKSGRVDHCLTSAFTILSHTSWIVNQT